METAEYGSAADCGSHIVNDLSDALRYIGDVSYAILPKDLAHSVGDLKKSLGEAEEKRFYLEARRIRSAP